MNALRMILTAICFIVVYLVPVAFVAGAVIVSIYGNVGTGVLLSFISLLAACFTLQRNIDFKL